MGQKQKRIRQKDTMLADCVLTLIARVAVTVDFLRAGVEDAGVCVLVPAARTAGAHAGPTRDSNPHARVSMVTIQAPVAKQRQ